MRRVTYSLLIVLAVTAFSACSSSRPKAIEEKPAASSTSQSAGRSALAGAIDWPQFRGLKQDGISPEKGLNKTWSTRPPKKIWQFPMSDDGYSGPSVANGQVYIIDHKVNQDILRAINFKTGQETWHYAYPDTDQANYGFARATPTVDHGKVYSLSRLGLLNCLNAATGKLIWSLDIIKEFNGNRPGWDLAYSPVIDGNKVIVLTGAQDAAAVALDKETGKTIWKGGGGDKPGYATPVIATINGKKQYVVFFEKSVTGIDPDTGAIIWSSPWTTSVPVHAAMPLVIGDSVFITSGYGRGCSLIDINGSEAKTRWENKEIQSHFNAPIYSNGYIYGTSDPGNLVCLNPANGQALWKQPGFEKGGIVAADGTIMALSGSNGEMAMCRLAPSGYKELGRFTPLGEQSWTPPILSHGMLIVRNKKTLACFELM